MTDELRKRLRQWISNVRQEGCQTQIWKLEADVDDLGAIFKSSGWVERDPDQSLPLRITGETVEEEARFAAIEQRILAAGWFKAKGSSK